MKGVACMISPWIGWYLGKNHRTNPNSSTQLFGSGNFEWGPCQLRTRCVRDATGRIRATVCKKRLIFLLACLQLMGAGSRRKRMEDQAQRGADTLIQYVL